MSKFNILEWWNNSYPLDSSDRELLEKTRKTDTYDNLLSDDITQYNYLCDCLFDKMPCCNLTTRDFWTITCDNCASNLINKLFFTYVDNDTLVIISNAEHETTVNNFNKCKNGLILDHSKDIRGYNYDKVINEAKKYKKVFFYCIGTQISTGEISPQTFFVELKSKFNENKIPVIMVLDAVQEMFLEPRDYSIFDYIIGTGHAICWNYDLGLLIHKVGMPVHGFIDDEHLREYSQILRVILSRKEKINMFTRCIHEYFSYLLKRDEFSIIYDNAPQLCSIRCKGITFDEELKELLDKYEIRIEAFGQETQFLRFRAQMFIKDDTLLLKGVNILENYLKGLLDE